MKQIFVHLISANLLAIVHPILSNPRPISTSTTPIHAVSDKNAGML